MNRFRVIKKSWGYEIRSDSGRGALLNDPRSNVKLGKIIYDNHPGGYKFAFVKGFFVTQLSTETITDIAKLMSKLEKGENIQ